ncbi:DnaJ domain-containing protein [Hahella sp. CR1]|uniref:DNA-J related domain-containing protein n=1 Tax=Hahella sp. CR1 TaxID=2992807 RepID=UPI002441D79C|nr:DNA-J related domain-containing protein [Hahella sp. CR1]MDG9667434.1 DnaJ domain-containing protein [Hahella sp. CR1]
MSFDHPEIPEDLTLAGTKGSREPTSWRYLTQKLEQAVAEILLPGPAMISEHDLIKQLTSPPHSIFSENCLQSPLDLFQTHFLTFHTLYRLKNKWLQEHNLVLAMTSVRITLYHYDAETHSNHNAPVAADPLAEYYLNPKNLFDTSAADVEKLIRDFWLMYVHPHQKQSALDTLGCAPDSDATQIKARYRRLAMEHHPDRGGDTALFQAITEAYEVLKVYYSL